MERRCYVNFSGKLHVLKKRISRLLLKLRFWDIFLHLNVMDAIIFQGDVDKVHYIAT
jgi:hypothetical protein